MNKYEFTTPFSIGQIVEYNAPFVGSVRPRFKIMMIIAQFDAATILCSYKVRQLFDHLEYERREGISTTEMILLEHELVSV